MDTHIKQSILFSLFAAVISLATLYSPAAWALDCAAAPVSEQTIAGSDIIFEGRMISARKPGFMEAAALKLTGHGDEGGGMSDLQIYDFSVSHGWKGTTRGATVSILRNTAWGDIFEEGDDYMIIASEVDDYYESSICGPSAPLRNAGETQNFLFDNMGMGVDFKVMGADAFCKKDVDCIAIITDCGGCGCGTPVSVNRLDKYRAIKEKTCAGGQMREMCEMECPPTTLRCINQRCTLQEPK